MIDERSTKSKTEDVSGDNLDSSSPCYEYKDNVKSKVYLKNVLDYFRQRSTLRMIKRYMRTVDMRMVS